jgi:putative hydrolase of the HAD superfamily
MAYTTVFFDLDDTLYPHESGLWQAIRDRMRLYMVEQLGLPAEDVPEIQRAYFQAYGTTLRGLQMHYQIDPDAYIAFVHDLPLKEYIQPNPALKDLLESLPQKRYIFTNADAGHAGRVMRTLGIEDCFDGVIDIKAIRWACKPEPESYRYALALAGDPDPQTCVLVDDAMRNLLAAREMGITTVLVRNTAISATEDGFSISSLLELPEVLPALWDGRVG